MACNAEKINAAKGERSKRSGAEGASLEIDSHYLLFPMHVGKLDCRMAPDLSLTRLK